MISHPFHAHPSILGVNPVTCRYVTLTQPDETHFIGDSNRHQYVLVCCGRVNIMGNVNWEQAG